MMEQTQQPVVTQRLTVAVGPSGRMRMLLADAAGHTWFCKFRTGQLTRLEGVLRGWMNNPDVPMTPGNANQLMEAAVLAQQLLMGKPPLFDYKPVFQKRAEDTPRRHGGHGGKKNGRKKGLIFFLPLLRVLRASVVGLLHLRKEEG